MHTEMVNDNSKVMATESKNMENGQANNVQPQQQEKSNDQISYENKNDRQKKRVTNDGKEYQNLSPRRNNNNKYNNRLSNYHNGNRQNNRNNLHQHRLDTNNNQKMQYHQNSYSNQNNFNNKLLSSQTQTNGLDLQSSNSSNNNNQMKKQVHKHRIVKSNNSGNHNFDQSQQRVDGGGSGDKNTIDDSGIHPNTSVSNHVIANAGETRLKFDPLMAGDNESINRKYSKDFLQQVGHKLTGNSILSPKAQQQQQQHSPKVLDDANVIALKMAFGDNSGYYNHLYSGAMYTNQLFYQTQQQQQHQQQQYQQSYARYQQQHFHQRLRMFQHENNNYQRVSQPEPLMARHQNQLEQRSYQNGYFHQQQQHNSFTFPNNNSNNGSNNRGKQNGNRKNRQANHNGNSNNSTNNNYNSNNKKLSDQKQAQPIRIATSKSDETNAHSYDDRRSTNNKNLRYIRTSSEDYRSLSPTPPSSVKSSSPGIQDKACDTQTLTELNDDSESTSSSIRSAMSFSSDNKELMLTPTILLTPIRQQQLQNNSSEVKVNHVNTWIKNNNFTPLSNGLSLSAEQLNVRAAETPVTIIKRPPSANGISSSSSTSNGSGSAQSQSVSKTLSLPQYDPTYPFEYYYAKGEFYEVREEPRNLNCGSVWDHVSQEIWEKFQLFKQTQETYRRKMILWRDLYEFIREFPFFQQRACPKWGLFLVGSTISGFGLDSSDVDMCLVLKTAPAQLDPRTEAMITLSSLKYYLINSGTTFQGFSLINAKVPILRFRDATNTIEVDLNYNNCIGVRNTHLLYCYSQLDWRLRPLAIIVKLWAQFHNINDARNSTISSYSLVLMVIHFLQSAVSPPVLPCLHQKYPKKFHPMHDITTIDMMERLDDDWRSENYQSLGELFLRFLDYYSNFDYSHHAISIRTGGILSIESCRNVKNIKNDPNHWQTLCIEEPFDQTNTARSTYDGEIFEKIKAVFFHSWRILREFKTLDSLFQEPLFVQQTGNSQQQHPLHNSNTALTNQLNDMKYLFYPSNAPINTSPIITTSQMNSEIAS